MEKKHLSLLGVGPIYVSIIGVITLIAIILQLNHIIPSYAFPIAYLSVAVGILFILLGALIWIMAVVKSKLVSKIVSNELVTTGVFAYVRNPIYSAFMLIFSGILLLLNNMYLLLLPLLYWAFLSVLLIKTEEKWLLDLYKEQYEEYMKNVNRCIPMIRRTKG